MILFDDVRDDDSNDDRTECDGEYVEPREGDLESAEDVASDVYCWNEVDATEKCSEVQQNVLHTFGAGGKMFW